MSGIETVLVRDGMLVRIRRWELYALVAEVYALIATLATIFRPVTRGEPPLVAAATFAVSFASILLLLAPVQSILARTYFGRETTLSQLLLVVSGGGVAGFVTSLVLHSLN